MDFQKEIVEVGQITQRVGRIIVDAADLDDPEILRKQMENLQNVLYIMAVLCFDDKDPKKFIDAYIRLLSR